MTDGKIQIWDGKVLVDTGKVATADECCCCGECACPGNACDNCPDTTPDTYLLTFTEPGGRTYEVCLWQDQVACQFDGEVGDDCEWQCRLSIQSGPKFSVYAWKSFAVNYEPDPQPVDCCCEAKDLPDEDGFTDVSVTPCCDPEVCEEAGDSGPCIECCGADHGGATISVTPDPCGENWGGDCHALDCTMDFWKCEGNEPAQEDCLFIWQGYPNACPDGYAWAYNDLRLWWDASAGKWWARGVATECRWGGDCEYGWEFGGAAENSWKDVTDGVACNPLTGKLTASFQLDSHVKCGENPCPDCKLNVVIG